MLSLKKQIKSGQTVPGATITLETTAPVCSKSTKFLADNGIEVKCHQSSRIKNEFITLTTMKMPFGKYKGLRLVDLPEPYLVWFSRKGFPEGKLGQTATDRL